MADLDFIQITQNIFLFQILGYLLLRIFFKPDKSGNIYCGIFAFNGPSNLSEALSHLVFSNIKMLGLYNDERGGDNAGILINNDILHTTSFESKFKTLLEKNHINSLNPTTSSVIIGHSRKGSVGGKGHENAHPFKIYKNSKEKDLDWYMAGVHNGTIENWEELLKNFNLDPKEFKNDSKTILKILSRQRNLRKYKSYNIFEKYKGAGVFVWYFKDEPDTMYVFKGAHKRYLSSTDEEEERPLFYYECPITEGIYFSSLKDSLEIISINKTNVKVFPQNVVIKIKEGKIIEKDNIKIDRSEWTEYNYNVNSGVNYGYANEEIDYSNVFHGRNNNVSVVHSSENQAKIGFKAQWQIEEEKLKEKTRALVAKVINEPSNNKPVTDTNNELKKYIHLADDYPTKGSKSYKDKICRQSGLYFINGKVITGEYIVNENNGLTFHTSQNWLLSEAENYKVRYFYEGYMLKGKAALIELTDLDKAFPSQAWKIDKAPYFISKHCNYPVPTWDGKLYYMNNVKASGEFTGLAHSEGKVYNFKDGKLLSVKKLIVEEPSSSNNALRIIYPESDKESIDPDSREAMGPVANKLETILKNASEKLVSITIEENEKEERKVEDYAIINAQEEDILELWLELHQKVQEQIYTMHPYIKDKSLNSIHFLSGCLESYGFACIEGGLTTKSGETPESPYFEMDDSGELIYKKISQLQFF